MTVFRPLSFPAANTGFFPGFHSGAEVIPSATGRAVPDPLADTPDCFVPVPGSVCFVDSGEDAGSQSPKLGFEQSWGRPISAYQAAYKVVSYGLNLKIDPDREFISGFTDIVLKPSERLSKIELDLVDHYKVSKVVLVDGQETRELDYRHSSHKLFVSAPYSDRPLFNPNGCYKIRVYYEGKPPVAVNPPWEGGFNWSRTDSGKAWVGVTSQNYGGKIWFPCKDHPSDRAESVTLNITVPQGLYVVSNGLLDGVTDAGDGFQTFHWQTRYPTSNYAISINVGDYQIDASTYGENKIPLLFYSLREYQKADQDPKDPRTYEQKRGDLLASAREYLDFFERHFGPYPWGDEKIAFVQTDYLGMEHQTHNSYGGHFRHQNGFYDILFHELCHEWWGNKINVSSWADLWLHEATAKYFELLYLEERYGFDYYRELLWSIGGRMVDQPIVLHDRIFAPMDDAFSKIKDGASMLRSIWMMHFLRFLLGKDKLLSILHGFAMDPLYTSPRQTSTEDFVGYIQKKAGLDLNWFFDFMLHSHLTPTLDVRSESGKLELFWYHEHWETKEKQVLPEFNMPVEVQITNGDQVKILRVEMKEGRAVIDLQPGDQIVVDPNKWVLNLRTPR